MTLQQLKYLRGYTYAFIEMFAGHLTRGRVEQAIRDAASRIGTGLAASA